jgi:hypothetical protein
MINNVLRHLTSYITIGNQIIKKTLKKQQFKLCIQDFDRSYKSYKQTSPIK